MSIAYIIVYLIMVIGVDMTLGKKATFYLVALVLLSVIVVNSNKITELLNSFNTSKKISGAGGTTGGQGTTRSW